ncbi:MAG: hypothetical protein WBL65_18230 [Bryobacteraceae bacterium]
MLPDFPKVKEVLVAHARAQIEQVIRQEPILRGIRRVHHFEGSEMRTQPSTGPVQSSGYEHYTSANIEVPTDAIIEQGPAAFFEQVRMLAEDLKAHQVRTMLARVGEAADSVGNVVHGGGQPYGPDLFFEMLEKITISFDEDGNPQMPMAVVSPETAAYIRAHAAAWEADPAFRERHARILQRKREEWDDRERHRELVD